MVKVLQEDTRTMQLRVPGDNVCSCILVNFESTHSDRTALANRCRLEPGDIAVVHNNNTLKRLGDSIASAKTLAY